MEYDRNKQRKEVCYELFDPGCDDAWTGRKGQGPQDQPCQCEDPCRCGNHRFTVVVETPARLTKEQKDLLRQLEGSIEETPKIKKFFDNLKNFFD